MAPQPPFGLIVPKHLRKRRPGNWSPPPSDEFWVKEKKHADWQMWVFEQATRTDKDFAIKEGYLPWSDNLYAEYYRRYHRTRLLASDPKSL